MRTVPGLSTSATQGVCVCVRASTGLCAGLATRTSLASSASVSHYAVTRSKDPTHQTSYFCIGVAA